MHRLRRHSAHALAAVAVAVALLLADWPAGTTAPVAAADPAPVVHATPTSGFAPLEVAFTIEGADAATTTWDFGDGASVILDPGTTGTGHTYTDAGSFDVTVEVSLDGTPLPSPDPVTITVTVDPDAPVAAMTASSTLTAIGRTLSFTSTSTGVIESLKWDFGDGSGATGAGPVKHGWTTAGTFKVTLTAKGGGRTSTAVTSVRVLTAWTGSKNRYRSSAFVKQFTSTWCTAASVQFMRNINLRLSDRTKSLQYKIIVYERSADTLAVSKGSDPRGMALAMAKFGAGTYADKTYTSLRQAVEAAARRIRLTGRPVALLVWGGKHVWTMHGFRASADPAFTTSNVVTHVIVSGSLGTPSDPVNKAMSLTSLKPNFKQYWQTDGWMGWYGKWVIVAP
jgi:PKD repeat protein